MILQQLHDDNYGAFDLDFTAGEYGITHFADPDRKPSALVLIPIDIAVTMAQAILQKSAPHLLAGYRAKVVIPAPDGNVVQFRRA